MMRFEAGTPPNTLGSVGADPAISGLANKEADISVRTPRLFVLPPKPGQGANYAAYYTANHDFHSQWIPNVAERYFDDGFWEDKITERKRLASEGREVHLLMWHYDVLIGEIGITNIRQAPFYTAELNFSLDHQILRQALMLEALIPVIDQVSKKFNIHRFEARYVPRNERAGKTLRRVGFSVEGCCRGYAMVNGRWEDHILSSRIMHV
jgi:ribosomal-protein-alanine N-acetyltransferase